MTDVLLLVLQLVQLAIAYETTCWSPEVPDPLFSPPPQAQTPAAASSSQPGLKARTRPRERRSRSGPSLNPRTTRAGYRDVLVRRSRHVRTSTANFHPDTPIIDLPLGTLARLLTRSFVLGEDVSLPGPATELRRRVGILSETMALLMRARAARQQRVEGQVPGSLAASR